MNVWLYIYGYVCMAINVWLYIYGYVCMVMYVWLCRYGLCVDMYVRGCITLST